jgi:purine nucleosidase
MGRIGAYLADGIDRVVERAAQRGHNLGEPYARRDSPLVVVTVLQTPSQPDSSSGSSVTIAMPELGFDGLCRANASGRRLRVYTCVDTRLMFEDSSTSLRRSPRRGQRDGCSRRPPAVTAPDARPRWRLLP